MGSSSTHKTDPTLDTNEENESHPSCQLNLTLASSVSQINPCQDTDTIPQSFEDIGKPPSENVTFNPKPTNNAAPLAPTAVPTRVSDVFCEQILTERPGSSDVDDTRISVHSHNTPQTSTFDPERAAFEEEIDKLKHEKTSLEKNLIRYKQQQPASKAAMKMVEVHNSDYPKAAQELQRRRPAGC
ncbi:heat stress transcription factor A-5 [Tanacetum coccineum]